MSEENGARPIAVANAPVSYGAFELTVGHDPNVPDGITVLDQVAAAGYDGIDLGPVGYLGSGERLGELLAERGLGLAGAYVELPYADPDALERALPELDAILDTFDAVRSYLPGPPPRPTLAEAGSAGPAQPAGPFGAGPVARVRRRRLAPVRGGPGPGDRTLPRPRLRADVPPGDRDQRRGAVGDRAGARGVRRRAVPGDRAHAAGRRRSGGACCADLGDRVNHVHLKDARLAVWAGSSPTRRR